MSHPDAPHLPDALGPTDPALGGTATSTPGTATPSAPWQWPALRDMQRMILLDVLLHGRRSRADAGRRSGLPRASLGRAIHDLVGLGLLREAPAETEGPGRPSGTLEIDPAGASFLGMKLTGDALYTVVSDLSGSVVHAEGEPLLTRELPDVLALITRTARRLLQQHPRLAALGICLAGDVRQDVDQGAVVIDSAFLGWRETPLQALIAEATGLSVTVSNDVQALTAAHHWFGSGLGTDPLVVIALGAGIGCGITSGDTPLRGAHGHPGKVGHLPVGREHGDERAPRCLQGHPGCVSAYATIPAILKGAGLRSVTEVLEAARAGEPRAGAALEGAAEALGAVVAAIANLVDPELVIITGESLTIVQRYQEVVEAAARARLDPASEMPRLAMPAFAFTDFAWGAAVTSLHATI